MRKCTLPRLPLFPMFFRLEGKLCVVVGAGVVAEEKINSLVASGASIRLVAPDATPGIARLARMGKLCWRVKRFQSIDLAKAFLVVAATSSPKVHEHVWRAAKRRGVLCNVVDDPARCDFFCGAVVRRGSLEIAISTGGRSPALAQQLRQHLERQFGAEHAEWVAELGRARRLSLATEPDAAKRKELAHKQARHVLGRVPLQRRRKA